MRIIGGKFKGNPILPVQQSAVRPTAARVRESVFNILASYTQEAVVLDLFAGTGAMGMEAISRGAIFAVFIDQNKKMLSRIERSVRQLNIVRQTKILRWNIIKNLNCIRSFQFALPEHLSAYPNGPSTREINLVFIDPPYNKGFIEPTLRHLNTCKALSNGTIVVIEHALSESIPENLMAYRITDQRKYGQTHLSFLEYTRE